MRSAFSFLVIGALVSIAGAQTNVSGTIAENTTWTKANQPYYVTDAITVNSGVTLTIEPGVDVLFDADVQLIVQGRLQAIGTETDSIRFLASAVNDFGEWGGIRISGGDSSTMAYARISDGNADTPTYPNDFGGGVCVRGTGTRLALASSVIRNNTTSAQGGGIWAGEGAQVYLVRCLVVDNVCIAYSGGGGFMANGGNISFDRCTIVGNNAQALGGGGCAANGAVVTVTSCIVWNNVGTAFLESGGVVVASYSDI